MNIYERYASGEHDRRFFEQQKQPASQIRLRPLSGQFDVHLPDTTACKPVSFWKSICPQAAFFTGHDSVLFGHVVTLVYKNTSTSKICAASVTKFGTNVYENIILDASSRFWPACENLDEQHRHSNVRRALAIANLKNFNKLWNNRGSLTLDSPWDETNAGALASTMELMDTQTPEALGNALLSLGLLQELFLSSLMVDVVYNNADPEGGQKVVEENNSLVTLLGTQMEQLFDPLLEYLPQAMEYQYAPPAHAETYLSYNASVEKVVQELVDVQSHFTMDLIGLLQDFIIPLRVKVLGASPTSTMGMLKVNLIFPPTIDEVTRINCIIHNLLQEAQKHGYMEVFRVLGTLLPFSYKAFVRHQANIAKFHSRFAKFVEHNKEYAIDDEDTNKGNYTTRGIESIITGTVFELPKLKLIIMRLYQLILSEKQKISLFEEKLDEEADELEQHYNSAIRTIDAFGYNGESTELAQKSRIFTPSGKLLTELATGWPAELQYGWMTRKVLGVFEMKNTRDSVNSTSHEALIIFSDHLLFLEVASSDGAKSSLKLSDVLMNSLINQKPFPKLSYFPDLKVKYWSGIDNVVVRSHETDSGCGISFTTYCKNEFRSKDSSEFLHVQTYDMMDKTDTNTRNSIVDLVTKAQILHKSAPFHLFKCTESGLTRYYCAHDQKDYASEISKSPVAILLSMTKEDVEQVFNAHPQVYLVFTMTYLNDHTVQLTGQNREKTFSMEEIVTVEDLNFSLREMLSNGLELMFHSSYLMTDLVNSNHEMIQDFLERISEKPTMTRSLKSSLSLGTFKATSEAGIEDSSVFDNYSTYPETIAHVEEGPKAIPPAAQPQKAEAKNRKSFVQAFMHKLKRKNKHSGLTDEQAKAARDRKSQAKIPNTGIPRGRKQKFKRLYKPAPQLDEMSTVSSTPTQDRVPSGEVRFTKAPEFKSYDMNGAYDTTLGTVTDEGEAYVSNQKRLASGFTGTSSRYTSGSIDVNSQFNFPNANSETGDEGIRKSVDTIKYSPISGSVLDVENGSFKTALSHQGTRQPEVSEGLQIELPMATSQASEEPRKVSNGSASTIKSSIKSRRSEPNQPTETIIEPQIVAAPAAAPQPRAQVYRSLFAEAPIATSKPIVTEAPKTVSQPIVTEATKAVSKPIVTEAPHATSQPIVTESPKVVSKPSVTEPKHSVEAQPVEAQPPVLAEVNEPKLTEPAPVMASETEREIEEAAPESPRIDAIEPQSESSMPKRRIFSSQDIALALENINATGISPDIYNKYKVYDEMPTSVLVNDGEANWVAMSRDNSSNLQSEVQAMKEAAHMNSLDVIDVTPSSMLMKPSVQQFDSSDGTFSTVEMVTIVQDDNTEPAIRAPRLIYDVMMPQKDQSSLSLSSQFVNDFGRQLDKEFCLSNSDLAHNYLYLASLAEDDGAETITEPEVSVPSMHTALDRSEESIERSVVGMSLGSNVTSSEEEYFSSQDFASAMEFMKTADKKPESMTTSSSEKTLMCELLNDKDATFSPDMRLDLIAYLSDVLQGNVEI